MATNKIGIIGDDPDAKSAPLRNTRLLEPLGYFNVQLGYVLGMGTQIGFKLLHDTKGFVLLPG